MKQYTISQLLAHAYMTMDKYHRTQCLFSKCDCGNKLNQMQEFYGLYAPDGGKAWII